MTADLELMAFWSYDQYPYVLWGNVVAVDDKGRVQTREYGPGMLFTPSLIISAARGRDLAAKLEVLKGEKRDAINAVHAEFRTRLAAFQKNERVQF
jgi:hypothetical protein